MILHTLPAIIVAYLIKYLIKINGKETFLFYAHHKDPFTLIEIIKQSDSQLKKYLLSLILIIYVLTIILFLQGISSVIHPISS